MKELKNEQLFPGLINQDNICFDYVMVDNIKCKKRKYLKIITLADSQTAYTDIDKEILTRNLNLNFARYKKVFIYIGSNIAQLAKAKYNAIGYKENIDKKKIKIIDPETFEDVFYNKEDVYYINVYGIVYDYKDTEDEIDYILKIGI